MSISLRSDGRGSFRRTRHLRSHTCRSSSGPRPGRMRCSKVSAPTSRVAASARSQLQPSSWRMLDVQSWTSPARARAICQDTTLQGPGTQVAAASIAAMAALLSGSVAEASDLAQCALQLAYQEGNGLWPPRLRIVLAAATRQPQTLVQAITEARAAGRLGLQKSPRCSCPPGSASDAPDRAISTASSSFPSDGSRSSASNWCGAYP